MNKYNYKKKILYFITTLIFVILTIELISFATIKALRLPTLKSYYKTYEKIIPTKEMDYTLSGFNLGWANLKPHPYFGYVYADVGNNHGFRSEGDSQHIKKNPNEYIIAIFGGSVAEQFSSNVKSHLKKELKKIIFFKDKNIHFIKMAVGAYKQPQSMIISSIFATGIDLAITIDGYNEVTPRNSHSITSININPKNDIDPIFPIYYEGLFDYDKYDLLKFGQKFFLDNQFYYLTNRVKNNRLLSKSFFIFLSWNLTKNWVENTKNKSKFDHAVKLKTKKTISYKKKPFYQIDLWERFTRQQIAILATNNVHSIHFVQPNIQLHGSKPSREFDAYNANFEGEIINSTYPEMKLRAIKMRSEGHFVFDLYDIYKNELRKIFKDHVNSLGNEIMAKKIGETLNTLSIFKL